MGERPVIEHVSEGEPPLPHLTGGLADAPPERVKPKDGTLALSFLFLLGSFLALYQIFREFAKGGRVDRLLVLMLTVFGVPPLHASLKGFYTCWVYAKENDG